MLNAGLSQRNGFTVRRVQLISQFDSAAQRCCGQSALDRLKTEWWRGVHGHRCFLWPFGYGSNSKVIVVAGAECVSAPMEMRSGPAAAITRIFFKVMPPDTSTRARFLISRTAFLTMAGVMLSSKMISAFAEMAWVISSNDSTSTIVCIPDGAFVLARRVASRTASF